MLKEHRDRSESPATGDVSMVGGKTSTGVCAACFQCIEDRFYLLAVDRQWHLACLQCHHCKLPLHTQLTCYSRHGNIYCKEDYYRLFGIKRCARCQNGISSRELVMRARDDVYHVHCFTCASCSVRLAKGDHFGVRDGLIYCRPHYETLRHRDYFGPVELEPLSPGAFWNNGYSNGLTVKGRPRKRKIEYMPEEATDLTMMKIPSVVTGSSPDHALAMTNNNALCMESLHSRDLSSSMESLAYDSSSTTSPTSIHPNAHGGPPQRTKRMRTSFKHHQLRTMKSYFNVNQNPDAKDLKQLAQKTGLSKRVLQVWFQNARAKWRRNIMRQESSQSANGINLLPPVGAANGIRNEETNGSLISRESNLEVDDFSRQHQPTSSSQSLHFEELY